MKNKFKVLLVYPNLPLMLVPPLAVALFTKIIKDNGYDVDLFDTTEYIDLDEDMSPKNRVKYLQARDFDEESDLGVNVKTGLLNDYKNKIVSYSPDVIIYAAVVEDAFLKCTQMIDEVTGFNIPSIMGGVFPTVAPEKCLSYKNIHYVGIGEGENIVIDFIDSIYEGRDVESIRGIVYKNIDGEIKRTPPTGLVNIENVAPDFSLFAEERFYRPMGGRIFKSMPIETYRGCPYQCTYCNSPGQRDQSRARVKLTNGNNINETESYSNNFLRRKTMGNLSDEINEVITKYHPEFLYFIDDAFMARPKEEMIQFCEMYSKFKVPFWFNTRPENCTVEVLSELKNVGCYRISFGIECGNEKFRTNVLGRKGSNKDMVNWFNIISESKIPFSVNLIIGFPSETRDNVMETVELTRMIKGFDTITVSIFTPYHGTHLRDVAVNKGWLDDNVITVHTTSSSLLNMPLPFLSREEIDGLMRVIPLYVYFDKKEWSNIFRIEKMRDGWEELYDYYSSKYKINFLGETVKCDILVRGDSKTTTGCSSDPKNEV